MTIVKHTNADHMIKDALVLDLGDLQCEADRIIAQAQEEAQRILAEAEGGARKLIDAADEKGYEAGLARGQAEGRAEGIENGRQEAFDELRSRLDDLTNSWNDALGAWEQQRSDLFLEARTDVLRFALVLAGKIIHRQLTLDPLVVQRQLEESLKFVSAGSSVLVSIAPDDRTVIERALPDLLQRIGACEHVRIKENPNITRGGCIVSTAGGSIDATIETQLKRIAETLLPAPSAAVGPSAEDPDSQDSAE